MIRKINVDTIAVILNYIIMNVYLVYLKLQP